MSIQPDYKFSTDLICRPKIPLEYLPDEYDEAGFKTLFDMKHRHFWYPGRNIFLLALADRFLPKTGNRKDVIDLGWWVRFLTQHRADGLGQIALANSSL